MKLDINDLNVLFQWSYLEQGGKRFSLSQSCTQPHTTMTTPAEFNQSASEFIRIAHDQVNDYSWRLVATQLHVIITSNRFEIYTSLGTIFLFWLNNLGSRSKVPNQTILLFGSP